MGALVGEFVMTGALDGLAECDFVGAIVGDFVGDIVGALVGDFVGVFVGDFVGELVGEFDGDLVGLLVGTEPDNPPPHTQQAWLAVVPPNKGLAYKSP
jgi:hypothetical protein